MIVIIMIIYITKIVITITMDSGLKEREKRKLRFEHEV